MSHGELFQRGPSRVPDTAEKNVLYQQAGDALKAMLEGESDPCVVMSSIVAVLHHTMPHYFWTGFYRVAHDELRVGPYQGSPACLRIPRGRGVCGSAWDKGAPIVVEDVQAFPGHISCDSRSVSEIVVPWKTRDGAVIAVLDVDSEFPSAFDACDRDWLVTLAESHPLDG